MAMENERFWAWVAPTLRQAYGYVDMSPAETDAFLDTVEPEEITPEQIEQSIAELQALLTEPRTPAQIRATLIEAGYDPDAVAARMQAVAERAIKRAQKDRTND